MAESLQLVTKANVGGRDVINGVRAVLINADDGQTSAATIAEAVAQCNAAFPSQTGDDAYPADYFDTVTAVNVTAGALATDRAAYIFPEDSAPVLQAAPA